MGKTFVLFVLLVLSSVFPIACFYSNPYGPGGGNPYYTPVPNPTYATPAPRYKTSWGTAGGPNALAFGMGTTLYVAEADGTVALVQVFDSSNPSTPVTQWNSFGSTALKWPGGVATNAANGNVYVADNLNNAVFEFTPAGVTVLSWAGYGAMRFNAPEGIGADSLGNIYVADTGNGAVEEFDSNGNPLHIWYGGGSSSFSQPSAVALDGSNNVYVADAGNERVMEFGSGGTTLLGQTNMIQFADIFGIAVDGSGDLFAADYGDGTPYNGNGLMEEYNPAGPLSSSWASPSGSNSFGPDGVALYNSDVYVADFNNNLIQVFGP